MGQGEPQWLPEDIDAALEWADWKDSFCSCGHQRTESFDPRAEDAYEVEALKCHACAAQAAEAQLWRENEHANTAGVHYLVRRRED